VSDVDKKRGTKRRRQGERDAPPAFAGRAIVAPVGQAASDKAKATQERARAIADHVRTHPKTATPKPMPDEVIRQLRAKWNASNPTRIPLSLEPAVSKISAPRVQVSKRMPEARQKRAPMPDHRRLGETLPEMRSNVLRWCEGELRELATKDKADADAFLRGLRSIAADIESARQELKAVQHCHHLLMAIRNVRDEAKCLLKKSQPGSMSQVHAHSWNHLASLVELLNGREELFFSYPEGTRDLTHRELVLRQFDNGRFLGHYGRRADTRELALLSLFLDPDHGVTDGRGDKGTYWDVVKTEEDAIRIARKRLRKSNPLYGR
jgi:hypothetical protein